MEKILFISEKVSFMSDAIIRHLREARFEVTVVNTDVTNISRIEDMPPIFILYLQSEENMMPDVLGYLRDLIEEKGIRFFVIGTQEEVETVMSSFPSNSITHTFIRPLDIKELIKRMNKESEALSKVEEQKTLLVVDDDPTALRSLKNLLSAQYQVYVANSGMNAITVLAKSKVDLILLDFEMPIVNGAKVLEMLRSDPETSHIPVMFLSAKDEPQNIAEAARLKPEKYLLKSMQPKEILDSLEEFFTGQSSS